MLHSKNPYNEELNFSVKEDDFDTLDMKLSNAVIAFREWSRMSFQDRAGFFRTLVVVLDKNKKMYSELITTEMGKVIKESRKEIEKCIRASNFFADKAESYLADEVTDLDDGRGIVSYEPMGVILGIMPWNYPFWQALRFAIPAMLAGNVVVMKHASDVPRCLQKIEDAFKEANFPDHVFQGLFVPSSLMDHVIVDDRIQGVSITGSVPTGEHIGEVAGKKIKKTVMELGGSDPFIVLDDADVEKAAITGARARMTNNGQSCDAAKRFIIHEAVADRFLRKFREEMEALQPGDPMDEKSDYASLANEKQKEILSRQVEESINMGADIYWEGKKSGVGKAFFNPLILTNIKQDMPAYKEELFGPVASIFIVRDAYDAIHIANDTNFGLGASIWTSDIEKGMSLARQIQSGMVYINEEVSSRPELPFGGIKNSGIGRELSIIGIREFTNKKTIWHSVEKPQDAVEFFHI